MSNKFQSNGLAYNHRLIESDEFPIEFVSELAEMESWRKEVNRPIYHIHKWWAKRLGSVFRAILLGSALPETEKLEEVFYRKHDFSDLTVFDPFMGSGSTLIAAELHKRRAYGTEISPAYCDIIINRWQLHTGQKAKLVQP